jgi:flagellar basal-body rod protein FlgF
MLAQQQMLDVIANNLANINTTGFKSDRVTFREALDRSVYSTGDRQPRLLGRLGSGALVEGSAFTPDQGPSIPTGRTIDVAIEGEGFFTVRTPQGLRYTRDGSFLVDSQRRLVTKDGNLVVGQNGDITMPPGSDAGISDTGIVMVNGQKVDSLAIVTGRLKKQGKGLYAGSPQPVATPTLKAGALEGSNVSAIQEMVRMIETMRVFDANQRVVQAQDETLQKAVNDLARLG